MNDRDSERITSLLCGLGYQQVDDPASAHILLLNTCSIRAKAEAKVFSALGRLRKKSKGLSSLIGVGGCVAQQEGERIFERAPSVDFVFGPQSLHLLPEMIEKGRNGGKVCETRSMGDREVRFRHYRDFSGPVSLECRNESFADRQRDTHHAGITAYVTVMEGCDNSCAYCVVPRTRGREMSRPVDDIIAEIEGLVGRGVKEITLLGQNVNSYGKKERWMPFSELLSLIGGVSGLKRLRFTTSHPKDLSSDLVESFRRLKVLCPHIHLPLQSGSTRILNRMNRGYTREEYLEKVHSLRNCRPDIAITTDIIVGFPGEEEKDFLETMAMLEEVRFDGHFSFCYSSRPGTHAASMGSHIPRHIKEARLFRLQELQRKIVEEKNSSFVGRTVEVLVEGKSKRYSLFTGRTRCNRVVNFPGLSDMIGHEVKVSVREAFSNSLRGFLFDDEGLQERSR